MEKCINHLKSCYDPVGLIIYGSYSDGTSNYQSDFDALVICRGGAYRHDYTVVDGIQLDAHIYSTAYVKQAKDLDEFIQIYDGTVLLDESGIAEQLKMRVREYVDTIPAKSVQEKLYLKNWCEKMLRRAGRKDLEGIYRGHWLLTDSLSIYCDVRNWFYFGPKKTMLRLQKEDPVGYVLFCDALKQYEKLENWIHYIFEKT